MWEDVAVTPDFVLAFNSDSDTVFDIGSGHAFHPNTDPTLGPGLVLDVYPGRADDIIIKAEPTSSADGLTDNLVRVAGQLWVSGSQYRV
ncbi:hypothetical protein EVAR_46003_1 [Eumeta japonica]|uniref:Uncharacterized protein n=1 Tax=Eumeta variegata TaxID=151549 RepID=A0A4C1XBW3_EUMVA|nr:hypothetical protein EVAR_46003_1 [Eumeta japonica]